MTAATTKRAAELGTELRTRLKPGRLRRVGAKAGESEAELRDRFWTLLVRGHDALWRAGAFVYGRREVDARVPPLGSQVAGKRGKGQAPAPGGGPEAES
ncbi:MAG: hypothetical protein MUF34_31380 [Polyangiaceae bacterium]|nr:hypothetical protein [Polyangiaceae bacterium]